MSQKVLVSVGINQFLIPGVNALAGCVADAHNIREALCRRWGYQPGALLLDHDATVRAFLQAIAEASRQAGPDGQVLVSLSCHGDQQPDVSGDESDGFDERLVLADVVMTDDAFHDFISRLMPPTQTLVCWFDLCHCGTATRQARVSMASAASREVAAALAKRPGEPPMPRFLDYQTSRAIGYQPDVEAPATGPQVILLHGCSDDETAGDEGPSSPGGVGGTFTKAALRVLHEMDPAEGVTWREFARRYKKVVPKHKRQTPGIKTMRARELLEAHAFKQDGVL